MVNILDSFTKLYKRPPTESEIARMLEMTRKQEGWNNKQDEPKEVVKPREPKTPTKINDRNEYKWPKRASVRAKQVNRMLNDEITIERIAHYLDVNVSQVMSDIRAWDLPQKKNK